MCNCACLCVCVCVCVCVRVCIHVCVCVRVREVSPKALLFTNLSRTNDVRSERGNLTVQK